MKKTLKDIVFKDKVVLVRVDFNVPLKDGKIQDDSRIVAAIPTINYLIDNDAKLVLCSHLGKVNHKDEEKKNNDMKKNDMSLLVDCLSSHLKRKVIFSDKVVGEENELIISSMKNKEILLIQNTRFEKGEEENDASLARQLSKNIDVFVMDAFGSAHRAHASTYGVANILNNIGKETCIGFLMEKEIKALGNCVKSEIRPYIAILGGSKVSDKIKVIDGLLDKADKIIIGGAMAYTFLKSQGYDIGKSRVEEDQIEFAKSCLKKAKDKIILPLDHIVADNFENPTYINVSMDQNIIENLMGLDIGPRTIEYYKKELSDAKMIFWNGPMGVFENKFFEKGTFDIASKIISIENCFSVVGGGDSASACKHFGIDDKFSHVSTGGGASLEMIENEGHLPGVDIISDI